MNFLAHIYLSFGDGPTSVGNFIADNIRGRKYLHLPPDLQKGILLHRAIDTFTDGHPVPKRSSKRLHANYGHYSRVIVDLYYDHFLAKNWTSYSAEPLESFVANFYALLEEHHALLPERVQYMLPIMKAENWLYNYGNLNGMAQVLRGMNRRTGGRSKMDLAIRDLREHYTDFETDFTDFFQELVIFSQQKYFDLKND
ncbi:ACP phosphodiesterase [Maribacter sp. 2307ULW6-5]|uniref:acyl carrier protein phosphodiesterase n=1 Tax=Maribacter sp. 2307ULW6-5 TaxID=3386275 RepID=UPI0039BC3B16